MSTTKASKVQGIGKKKEEMASLSKLYLLSYNGFQTIGWSYLLLQTIRHLLIHKSSVGIWDSYGTVLLGFQSLAAVEVLHSITGIVPSNPFMTFTQVFSRVFQVWGIMYSVPEIQNTFSIPVTLLAWSITEVIRYSFYFANLLGKPPYFLTWCRYSFFYALYPAGVFGEVSNTLQALGPIKKNQLFSFSLPNQFNISFNYYYANILLLLTYFPLFPQLFNHMRRQREKVLATPKKKE